MKKISISVKIPKNQDIKNKINQLEFKDKEEPRKNNHKLIKNIKEQKEQNRNRSKKTKKTFENKNSKELNSQKIGTNQEINTNKISSNSNKSNNSNNLNEIETYLKKKTDVSLGFKTGDASTAVLFGAKMIGNFVKINKLKIYWLGGLSVGSYDPKQNGIKSSTVFRIQGGVGAEYYLLHCLSVLTEMGLRFTSLDGNGKNVNDFGVYVDWLPQAGIRFYFN